MSTYNDFTSSVDNYLKESQLPATPTAGDVYHIIHEDASTPVFCYSGTTAPTTSTACQNIGDKYIVNNTDIYECTNIVTSGGTTTYTWVKASSEQVFMATVSNTPEECTPFADIKAAYLAGKYIYMRHTSTWSFYNLTSVSDMTDPYIFYFTSVDSGRHLTLFTCQASGWTNVGTWTLAKEDSYSSSSSSTPSVSLSGDPVNTLVMNYSTTLTSFTISSVGDPGNGHGKWAKFTFRAGPDADVTPTYSDGATTHASVIGEALPTVPAGKYCELYFSTVKIGSVYSGKWVLSTLIYD